MPGLQLPGARIGFAYIWAIVLSPALLFAAGVALLALGFWRDAESVAAIGAIGIVASLILPRMQGAFEIGPGGIKGALEDVIFRGVLEKALQNGVGAERAIELASGASGSPGHQLLPPTSSLRQGADPLVATRERLVTTLVDQYVGESVRLEREARAIVERVAGEKGWAVREDVRRIGPGGTYTFDFVLTTEAAPVLLEAVNFRSQDVLNERVAEFVRAIQDHNFLAAFVVVPNNKAAAAYVPENVQIVPIGDLERKLREQEAGPGGEPNA